MTALQGEQRQAKFVCCIVMLQHENDPSPIIAQGECLGSILQAEQGENGFGYDSLFFSQDSQCSFGVLPLEEKKKISHRAKALAGLKQRLEQKACS